MKDRIRLGLFAALTTTLFVPANAGAESMRCGVHIVTTDQRHGMGKYEVLKRCGEPTERYGNTWVYEEPGKMRRVLRFGADGVLSDISTSR